MIFISSLQDWFQNDIDKKILQMKEVFALYSNKMQCSNIEGYLHRVPILSVNGIASWGRTKPHPIYQEWAKYPMFGKGLQKASSCPSEKWMVGWWRERKKREGKLGHYTKFKKKCKLKKSECVHSEEILYL